MISGGLWGALLTVTSCPRGFWRAPGCGAITDFVDGGHAVTWCRDYVWCLTLVPRLGAVHRLRAVPQLATCAACAACPTCRVADLPRRRPAASFPDLSCARGTCARLWCAPIRHPPLWHTHIRHTPASCAGIAPLADVREAACSLDPGLRAQLLGFFNIADQLQDLPAGDVDGDRDEDYSLWQY